MECSSLLIRKVPKARDTTMNKGYRNTSARRNLSFIPLPFSHKGFDVVHARREIILKYSSCERRRATMRRVKERKSSPQGRRLLKRWLKELRNLFVSFAWLMLLVSTPQAAGSLTSLLSLPDRVATSTYGPSSISAGDVGDGDEHGRFQSEMSTGSFDMGTERPMWNSSFLPDTLNETEYDWGPDYDSDAGYGRNGSRADDYQLYDVPMYLVVLLSLLYGAISFAAVIGNVLVLWVVLISRRMRTKTNMFIANLALADIIIAIFAIPFQFQAALLQRWNLPHFLCAFCPFVQVLSVNVSVFTLSAIAMDRYRAILYPFKAIRIPKKEAIYSVISIWSVSLLLALPQELDYKVIEIPDRKKMKPFCAPVTIPDTFRKYYILGLVVIQYVLPLLIISVAYARMAAKLWGSSAPGNKEESRDEHALKNKKKVVKMLAVVVALFALCWLPLQMYNFFQMITPINEYQYINIIWFCFHWLAMSNSCYNPFIYAIFSDKFQTEFKARIPCLRGRGVDDMYCSEVSEFEMRSCSRVPASQWNRSGRQSRRQVTEMATLNNFEEASISPSRKDQHVGITSSVVVDFHRPSPTICSTVTAAQIRVGL